MQKCGIVAIIGQPNVGKSTILNGFLKEKVAAISPKPETTRDTIRGILTEKNLQIIFIDTPGIHKPHNLLGKAMLSRAQGALMEADITLFITEEKTAFNKDDENILARLDHPKGDKKCIFIINKVDKAKDKKMLLPIIEKASKVYPFDEIMPMCALQEADLTRLLELVKSYLPEGPFLYPKDEVTDKTDSFIIKEIIREKILEVTYKEIPHSVAVVIDEMNEDRGKNLIRIYATVFVERTSQKSILIGKDGLMMKKIGKLARTEIEKLFNRHVYLNLWVKVYEKWKKDPNALRELGYSD